MLFRTQFYAPETDFYVLITGNVTPEGIYIDGENIRSEDIVSREGPNGQRETRYTVNLRKGWHSLLLVLRTRPTSRCTKNRMTCSTGARAVRR